MRFLLLLPALSLAQLGPSGQVDADRLSKIIESLHKDLLDYSFVFEGTVELGPARNPNDEQKEEFKQRFQGFYRYRNDGATYLDIISRGAETSSFMRTRHALLRDSGEKLTTVPDSRAPTPDVERRPRSLLQVFSETGSPQHMVYHWYFERIKSLNTMGYEHLGWEDVDGHPCIKISLYLFTSPPPEGKVRSRLILWIDLERSGNPLRADVLFEPPQVAMRTHEIRLRQVPLPDGRSTWFPTSAVHDSFMVGPGNYQRDPVVRTTCKVVDSSLLFNQRPPDSVFSAKWSEEKPIASNLPLRKEFVEAKAEAPPPPRTDRKSVQERLDRQLEDADRQARMIEASSPSRGGWGMANLVQIGFGLLGIFLLGLLALRRNGRS